MDINIFLEKVKMLRKSDIELRDIEEIFGESISEEVVNFTINEVLNVDVKTATLDDNVEDYFSTSLVGVKLLKFVQVLHLASNFDISSEDKNEMLLAVADITNWSDDAVPCMSRLIAQYLCSKYELDFEDDLQLAILNSSNSYSDFKQSLMSKSPEQLDTENSQYYNYNKNNEYAKEIAECKGISYNMAKVFVDIIKTACEKYGLNSTEYLNILKQKSVYLSAEYIYSSIFRNF